MGGVGPVTATGTSRVGSGLTRLVRGFSGILTGGLVVLALVVLGAAIMASRRAVDGPEPIMVVVHLLAAAVAVVAQELGDRRGASGAVGAAAVVAALSAAVLWTQWWT